MRYLYPAVFQQEEGLYNVTFPDLPDCYTCGDDLIDAMFMAQDVLADVLSDKETTGAPIPKASQISAVTCPEGCIVMQVAADTNEWRRAHNTRAVKKTLSIPEWLNVAAEARGINFSQTLQEALRVQLGL